MAKNRAKVAKLVIAFSHSKSAISGAKQAFDLTAQAQANLWQDMRDQAGYLYDRTLQDQNLAAKLTSCRTVIIEIFFICKSFFNDSKSLI